LSIKMGTSLQVHGVRIMIDVIMTLSMPFSVFIFPLFNY